MAARRKPKPKLYWIKTFQLDKWKDGHGLVREYRVAANSRASAISSCDLQKDEAILDIFLIGTSTVSVTHWNKM